MSSFQADGDTGAGLRLLILFTAGILVGFGCDSQGNKPGENRTLEILKSGDFTQKTDFSPFLAGQKMAKTVNLRGDLGAREAIEKIESQTGHKLSIYGPAPGGKQQFQANDVPFWTAVLTVRNKFGFYLDDLGETVLFRKGIPRRAPAQVIGPFLVSRLVNLESGSEIPELIDELKSEDAGSKNEALQELQSRTGKKLPPDHDRWESWYNEEGHEKFPEKQIKHPESFYLEIWAEPGTNAGPMFTPPVIRVRTRNTVIKEMYTEKYLSTRNRDAWRFKPPISKTGDQPLTVTGTVYPNLKEKPVNVRLPLKENASQSLKQPSTLFEITRVQQTDNQTEFILKVTRSPGLPEEKRQRAQKLRSKLKSEKNVEFDKSDLEWLMEFHSKVYQDTPVVVVHSGQEKHEPRMIEEHRASMQTVRYRYRTEDAAVADGEVRIATHLTLKEVQLNIELNPVFIQKKPSVFRKNTEAD